MTTGTAPAPTVPAFRPFAVRVLRVVRLGRSFLRVTFTGDDLDEFASQGADQRIKVLFPLASSALEHCPLGDDWYAAWRALPDAHRNPMRSYTVRAARPLEREVDVDFVLHGPTGPASAWAERARRAPPTPGRPGRPRRPRRMLRRHLLREAGFDRRSVAFMGYWRRGREALT